MMITGMIAFTSVVFFHGCPGCSISRGDASALTPENIPHYRMILILKHFQNFRLVPGDDTDEIDSGRFA